jgi:hypothetical protein
MVKIIDLKDVYVLSLFIIYIQTFISIIIYILSSEFLNLDINDTIQKAVVLPRKLVGTNDCPAI